MACGLVVRIGYLTMDFYLYMGLDTKIIDESDEEVVRVNWV